MHIESYINLISCLLAACISLPLSSLCVFFYILYFLKTKEKAGDFGASSELSCSYADQVQVQVSVQDCIAAELQCLWRR